MTKTKNIALLLAAFLALVPSALLAQDESNMYMHKSVSGPTDDGIYTLTLESYAKGEKTIIETHTATDIVLVLDVSGSMKDGMKVGVVKSVTDLDKEYGRAEGYYYFDYTFIIVPVRCTVRYVDTPNNTGHSGWQFESDVSGGWKDFEDAKLDLSECTIYVKKIDALKNAVKRFIDTVHTDTQQDYNKDDVADNLDHKISIVKFAGNYYDYDSDKDKDDISKLLVEGNHTGNTELVKNLTDVSDKANATALKEIVDDLVGNGATAADYGMNIAKVVFDNTKGKDGKYPNRPRVVVFFTDGDPNHGNGFSTTVANSTIALSKDIKATSSDRSTIGAKVYTVGVFSSPTTNETKYMNYVSSNYPEASDMDFKGEPESDTYYSNVTSETALKSIFESIAKEIGGTEIALDETSLVIDIITSDFTLPVGAVASDITVKTAGYNAGTGTFADSKDFNDAQVTLTGSNKVTVSNFDFSEHWCGPGATSGQKLIIEIPIIESSTNKGGINIPTNEANSGIYKADETDPTFRYTPPKVSIPLLKIVKKGLKAGESAVFTITEGTGSTARTFTVTAIGTGSDVTTIIKAKDNTTYSVAETGWSWTYTPDSTSPQTVTFNGEAEKTVTFTNTSKSTDVDHAEAVVKNNFKTQTHTVTTSK